MDDRRDWGPPKKRARIPSRGCNREVLPGPPEDTNIEPSPPVAPSKPAPIEPPPQHDYNTRGGRQPHPEDPPFSSSYQPAENAPRRDIVAQAVLERKNRRQYLSNIRLDKRRKQIAMINNKPEHERTTEETEFLQKANDQRLRKNLRTKERAHEKKAQAERILALPPDDRTEEEEKTLALYLATIEHKNEGDRLRRMREKQALKNRDRDARFKKAARHTIAAASGSAYWEPQRDYRYPPPYPYPPMQPPPPPLPPSRRRRSEFVPVAENQLIDNILHDEHSHLPFQLPVYPLLSNQNEPDSYPDGARAPPFQHPLLLREQAAVPSKSGGHSFQVKQDVAKASSADSSKEKTDGVYTEDLKYPKRGRRRLPKLSDADIEEREKVRRTLQNERKRERVERAKDRMAMILRKAEFERTEEENLFAERYEHNRAMKNERGRERNRKRKEKMEDLLAKPKGERTREQTEWLATELKKKKRKNLKDRSYRLRIKEDKIKILESVLGLEDLEEYPQELLEDSD